MRSLILDMPNGRELVNELDLATEQMMSIPVELIGCAEWLAASHRQQQAFQKWRAYLQLMADGRVPIEALKVA
ncbi:hypothetical protein NTD84_09995 [Pseudomonas sp. 14P_8.1_Bac3]|uniref:hypothetical protein n=1 Tax=Pseudomonas sp. 14P_8.1_Bac3 TaxID=2971621 RepID=UPI0021C6797A|nr:hypothetical protein [Pseudomonas sp. 14P_8.1_Bac3]MCU1760040.1 hypothetical protein [Pseudomonas sp. 14P_8.1_Bac3]